jgi:hypothetical protein
MAERTGRLFRTVPVRAPARTWFTVLLVVVASTLIAISVTLLRTPRISYTINAGSLHIHATLGSRQEDKVIPLARISEARPEWLHGGSLRFGTEKPGCCVGFYDYQRTGEVWQATDCSAEVVLLRASSEVTPVVIVPPDREAFIRALWANSSGVWEVSGRRTASWWLTLVTLLLLLVIVTAALVVVFFVAPARISYLVRAGVLEVLWFGGSRQVRLTSCRAFKHWPILGERLAGVRLPGYVVGSWLLDSMATSVAASSFEDGVIVEADGRMFVTPRDRDDFLAALAEAGATVVTPQLTRRR